MDARGMLSVEINVSWCQRRGRGRGRGGREGRGREGRKRGRELVAGLLINAPAYGAEWEGLSDSGRPRPRARPTGSSCPAPPRHRIAPVHTVAWRGGWGGHGRGGGGMAARMYTAICVTTTPARSANIDVHTLCHAYAHRVPTVPTVFELFTTRRRKD